MATLDIGYPSWSTQGYIIQYIQVEIIINAFILNDSIISKCKIFSQRGKYPVSRAPYVCLNAINHKTSIEFTAKMYYGTLLTKSKASTRVFP